MKKILALLFFVTSIVNAQYTITGTITPSLESDWVILYKIEGARQISVANTKINIDTLTIDGKKQAIGSFTFTLPKNAASGSYRATYRLKGAGFVDFIFNKEDVSFVFNPDYPDQTIVFSKSKENKIYKEYLETIAKQQQKLDSLQITALRNKNLDLSKEYKSTLNTINTIQNKYLKATKDLYVNSFIKATLRANPLEIKKSPKEYMSNMTATFFDNMDFSDKALINSSFLIDRITDYVFYINYSEDKSRQQYLFKNSIEKILPKISNVAFKKDVIEFLITQFESTKNIELIDYLFNNHYSKLPTSLQNREFIKEKTAISATEIGRIAPNFTWKSNNKEMSLLKLNNTKNYVLVFWSTDCSHCLREIPEMHKALQNNNNIKVIAFAMERNDFGWKNMKKTLPNWHHVLGLNKWENKVARKYNINATPTYFILDKDKKIIAKPETISEVLTYIKKL